MGLVMPQLDRPENHQDLVGFIWSIADKLRGPYRPHQYRRVMLPMIVLRRLDLILEPTKDLVLKKAAQLEAKGVTGLTLEKALSKVAIGEDRTQPLYNTTQWTFQKLLGDAPGMAGNFVTAESGCEFGFVWAGI
jgi:type I restriction enzyme M protein